MDTHEEDDLLADTEDTCKDKFLDIQEETEYTSFEMTETTNGGTTFHKMDVMENDDEEEEDYQLFAKVRFKDIRQSRYCSTMTYIFLLVFVIVTFITFTVIVTLLIVPFARVAHFRSATCNVTLTTEHVTEGLCSCEEDCEMLIPCLVVEVVYRDARDGAAHRAMLYDNELLLDLKCSYYPTCKSEHADNIEEVKGFKNVYGIPGQTFLCFYNPIRHKEVIRSHRFELHHVLHASIWSSAALVAAIVLLAITVRTRGCF